MQIGLSRERNDQAGPDVSLAAQAPRVQEQSPLKLLANEGPKNVSGNREIVNFH